MNFQAFLITVHLLIRKEVTMRFILITAMMALVSANAMATVKVGGILPKVTISGDEGGRVDGKGIVAMCFRAVDRRIRSGIQNQIGPKIFQ